MKTCPYCAEDIQDAAIKCRYCGSNLTIAPGNTPGGMRQPLRVAVWKGVPALVAGAALLVIFAAVIFSLTITYVMQIRTRSEEVTTLQGSDKQGLQKIAAAINRAMVERQ